MTAAINRFESQDGSGVAYLLRIPRVIDRVKYRHALRAAGAKRWAESQMLDALEAGVKAIMTEPADLER
jgi:hypothetical protein